MGSCLAKVTGTQSCSFSYSKKSLCSGPEGRGPLHPVDMSLGRRTVFKLTRVLSRGNMGTAFPMGLLLICLSCDCGPREEGTAPAVSSRLCAVARAPSVPCRVGQALLP